MFAFGTIKKQKNITFFIVQLKINLNYLIIHIGNNFSENKENTSKHNGLQHLYSKENVQGNCSGAGYHCSLVVVNIQISQ